MSKTLTGSLSLAIPSKELGSTSRFRNLFGTTLNNKNYEALNVSLTVGSNLLRVRRSLPLFFLCGGLHRPPLAIDSGGGGGESSRTAAGFEPPPPSTFDDVIFDLTGRCVELWVEMGWANLSVAGSPPHPPRC